MKPLLPTSISISNFSKNVLKRLIVEIRMNCALLAFVTCLFISSINYAQWTPLTNFAPNVNYGVMLLLSDGTVMCKSNAGGGDGIGNTWNLLTPDNTGSYVNGTWTTLAPMAKTRLYFSSQVLRDGRVFVAGGEYGTGGNFMEVYNPKTNTWGNELNYGFKISDANSEILPDGRVLVSPVGNRPNTFIYNPVDNTFQAGPDNLGDTNESAWLKLPDNSIIFIQTLGTRSERFIPATNSWQSDANVPVPLYEPLGAETGPAFLLPDGRAFFIGGNSNTAYYTPSGTTANGSWAAGPRIPDSQAAPDAAAAMMRDGKILCAVSPNCCNVFTRPTSFYVFDYTAGADGAFTQINAPAGGLTTNIYTYQTNMLILPNGQVLYSQIGSSRYYVYTPGPQLAENRPVIDSFVKHPDESFTLFGTQFNGWSEGAGYGDDWQMNTNYPIVQLTNGNAVYYSRTYNWSSTGVRTGATPQTTEFSLPAGLPAANYSLRVIANGVASDPVPFCTPAIDAFTSVTSNYNGRDVSCFNSCDGSATLEVSNAASPTYSWSNGTAVIATTQSVNNLCPGTYTATVTNQDGSGCSVTKSVIIQNTPALTLDPVATSIYNGFGVSCYGGNNGTGTATPTGGTPPYTYNWSDGQTSATANSLSAGNYSVTISDANNCSVSGSITITQPSQLTATAAVTSYFNGYNTKCSGGNEGGVEAFAEGGVAPYSYSWSNGHSGKILTGLWAGTYTVTITDANGCTATAAMVTVTEPTPLEVDAGNNKTVYYGYPDSSCVRLAAIVNGGVAPYYFTWSNGSPEAAIDVCPAATTVYTVTITDANGCTVSDRVQVCVIDLRCGNNMDMVTISHKTNSKKNTCRTLCIPVAAARNHFLNHADDELGACGTTKGCSSFEPAITTARTSNQITIENTVGESYVKAFPNPSSVSTTIQFRIAGDDMAQLKVFDISGKEVATLYNKNVEANKLYQVQLNTSSLTNGIYLLKLYSLHHKSIVSKLLISK